MTGQSFELILGMIGLIAIMLLLVGRSGKG